MIKKVYTADQERAIRHGAGPMRVLAGPGSGKTAVITERIKNLIYSYGIPPEKILVITFTKEAAKEMQRRFYELMQKEYAPVCFGTFHAVFFRILKETCHFSPESILTEAEKRKFLADVIRKRQLNADTHPETLMSILEKMNLQEERDSEETNSEETDSEKEFLILQQEYTDWKRREKKLDFDDMDRMCISLFKKQKQILRRWQKEFEYILIDEFQDISRTQYEAVQMIAAPENNLFIVGDDDQSIYSFRGADPEIMMGFESDYPEAEQVLLGVNYRSSREIVLAASKMISQNKTRLQKKITSFQDKEGEKVRIRSFPDKTQQYRTVAEELKALQEQGTAGSAAVIARTNSMFAEMARIFSDRKIVFRTREKRKCIYEEEIFEDFTAYLKLASGDRSRTNILKILNKPARGLHREELDEIVILEEVLKQNTDRRNVYAEVDRLIRDLGLLSGMPLFLAVNYIRKGMNYDRYWLQKHGQGEKWEEYQNKADFLQESCRECISLSAWLEKAETAKKEWNSMQEGRDKSAPERYTVSLLTMHASKGLEFDLVFMPDCNEGISPYHKAKEEKEVEEERRMFYVGMTRARQKLELLYVAGSEEKPLFPSRFLSLLN